MDVTLVQLSAVSLTLVPVILALTSVAKAWVDARWSPLVSLVLGILLAFVAPMATIQLTLLQGVLMGLMASGLYSGVKTIASSTV